jgi:hypothetical protein
MFTILSECIEISVKVCANSVGVLSQPGMEGPLCGALSHLHLISVTLWSLQFDSHSIFLLMFFFSVFPHSLLSIYHTHSAQLLLSTASSCLINPLRPLAYKLLLTPSNQLRNIHKMSDGNAFWAAGKHIVTSASCSTPTIADAPPKVTPEAITPQKRGLILKSRSNGRNTSSVIHGNGNGVAVTHPVGKKISWADEAEDEAFLGRFVDQPNNPSIKDLQTTLTVNEERIMELEAIIVGKDLRIAELEGTVQDSYDTIQDLEEGLRVNDNTIEMLEKENYVQYIEIQDLYRESMEKEDCIRKLAAKLEWFSITKDPEQTSIPQPEFSAMKNDAEHIETLKTGIEESTTSELGSELSNIVDTPKSGGPTSKTTAIAKNEGCSNGQTEKVVPGLTFDDSGFPIFITKETLKVVPPAPKPRQLTFPIDMSKYGKKPVTALSAERPARSLASTTGRNGHTAPWGLLSKQTDGKIHVQPPFNSSADIRNMPHSERVMYGSGPSVIVRLGDVELKTLPQYALMQCSGKAMQHFKTNPEATSWTLPANSMDAEAAKFLLNWMEEMTYQGRVYSVTLNIAPAHDEKNMRICRAARVLGLSNKYVGHFTKHFCDRIRNKKGSYDFMKLVCELAYPENDPIFDCLANYLALQKATCSAEDKAMVKRLVSEHTVLRNKMEEIERKTGRSRTRK